MKTRLIATILLSVISLLLVLGGTSYAQSFDDRQPIYQPTISNTVYLPFVSNPPCTPVKPSVYIAVSDPVARVGEIVTATGAIVNDCQFVGKPWFGVGLNPTGILSVTSPLTNVLMLAVPIGGYVEDQITMLATNPGVVTLTMWVRYETLNYNFNPPMFYYDNAGSSPTVVRVLP
jgi:hypothetical protein